MSISNLLEQALFYAEKLHWPIFPCRPGEKPPAIKNWRNVATTDAEQIKRWWTENPSYNIGFPTDAAKHFVTDADVDISKGKNGLEVVRQFEVENGPFPKTACSRTPRGGMHQHYRCGEGFAKTCTNVRPGIDVRADGGYVLLPPSIVNGKSYEWILHPIIYGLAQANDSVLSFITPPIKESPSNKEVQRFDLPSEIGEGSRVDTLIRAIGSMRAKGFSEQAIRAAINAENEARCNPPLTDDELEKQVFPALSRDWKASNPFDQTTQQAAEAQRQAAQSASVTCLADVPEKEAEWLVPGYIPKREITIVAGDGGVGKSFAWCSLAASISTGNPCFLLENTLTAFTPEPQKVMFFSSEDSSQYILRRRLRENGADLHNIVTIDCGDQRFADIRLDSVFLERLLEEHRPALCIFDPLQSFLPAGTQMISRADMRLAMGKLHYFGEVFGTTFLIVMHCNKQTSVWGRSRLADSADIWDIARSVLIVGKPVGRDNVRYISHEKCNYGRQQPTVLYRIEDGKVVFAGHSDKRDREFMLESSKLQRSTPAIDDACALILDCVNSEGKCTPAHLMEIGKLNGLQPKTIRLAREKLETQQKLSKSIEGSGRGKGTQTYYLPTPTA